MEKKGFGGFCVLPDAKVKISSVFCYFPKYLNNNDIKYIENHLYSNKEINIEYLYDIFKNKKEVYIQLK